MDRFNRPKHANWLSRTANQPRLAGSIGVFALAALTLTTLASLIGCTTDEVGRTKTTSKETIDSPTQRSTVTETRTKETTFTPR